VSPSLFPLLCLCFLSETVDLIQENFSPSLYLSKIHSKTPMKELLRGKKTLEERVLSRAQKLKLLVSENFSHFCACKNTIDRLLEIDFEDAINFTPAETISDTIKELVTNITNAFQKLFTRQTEIDQIKDILSILTRSQFVFNIPSIMRENIATVYTPSLFFFFSFVYPT